MRKRGLKSVFGAGGTSRRKGVVACAAAAFLILMGATFASADTINFTAPGIVNQTQVYTQAMNKASCDGNTDSLKQVIITFGQLYMQTDLGLVNAGSGPATYTLESLRHEEMRLDIVGTGQFSRPGALPNSTGQDFCIPDPCGGPSPTGNWIWTNVPVNGTIVKTDAWDTTGAQKVVVLNPGDPDFDFFKGPGTFNVTFTVRAGLTADTAGTWAGENETFATASLTVTYVCGEPGLTCVSKTFSKSSLSGPDDVVTATVEISNTGEVDINDLLIVDSMSDAGKMTIVPGSSTLPGGDPVEGPVGEWTFPIQTLAAGDDLTFSYNVQITGMEVADELCNQVTVYSDAFGLSSNGPDCRDCLTREPPPPVPAFSGLGLLALFGLIPLSWVFLNRRRKS